MARWQACVAGFATPFPFRLPLKNAQGSSSIWISNGVLDDFVPFSCNEWPSPDIPAGTHTTHMKGVHIYAFGSRTIRLFVNVAETISMLRQNTKMEILTPTISRKAAGSHQNKMLYVENLK
jgi:hypothetical protein